MIYLETQNNPTQNSRKSSEDDSKSKLSQLLGQLNKVEKRDVVHLAANNNINKMENYNLNVQNKKNPSENIQKTEPQFTPRFKFIKKDGLPTPNPINTIKKLGLAIPKNDMLRKKQQSVITITSIPKTQIRENEMKKNPREDNNEDEVSVSVLL